MKEEVHLFILWSEARYKEREILEDISSSFEIVKKYAVTWNEGNAYRNFSRFYAIKSRYAKSKMKHCGVGEFLVVLVKDYSPKYEKRQTNSGCEIVNRNIFDKKELYRSWSDGGHKIHATNNLDEVRHNLALLFGLNYEDFLKGLTKENSNSVEYVNRDLIGTNGWSSFQELFLVLNNTLDYVVLRNYEGYFNSILNDAHPDVDILVRDYNEARLVLGGKEIYPNTTRVANTITVGKDCINFDIRTLGDGYYCEDFAKDILMTRKYNDVGFYTPTEDYYYYSLIYHALVHKKSVASDYITRLKNMSSCDSPMFEERNMMSQLKDYMTNKNYHFVEPKDMSVYYNWTLIGVDVSKKRKAYYKYYSFRSRVKKYLIDLKVLSA